MPPRKTRTNKDLEKIVELAAIYLGQMLPKHEVKRRIRQAYQESTGSECQARTCEVVLAKARELLAKWSGRTKDDLRIEAVGFYTSVIQHPGTHMHEKLRARERLDALFGLDAPSETVVKGSKGEPVEVCVVDFVQGRQKAEEYRRQRLAEARAANGDGHVNGNGKHDEPRRDS